VSRARKLGLGVLVALALGALLWWDAGRRARARMKEREDEAAREVAREQELHDREPRPVVSGEPIDDDAAPRYRALENASFAAAPWTWPKGMQALVSGWSPGDPIPASVVKVLDEQEGDLAAVREAVRCTRCSLFWASPPDPGAQVYEGKKVGAHRGLGWLLILRGHEKASRGDVRGAIDEYLAAARLGIDIERAGSSEWLSHGTFVASCSFLSLGKLVARGRADEDRWTQIESGLDRLDPSLPSAESCFRRLRFEDFSRRAEEEKRMFTDAGLRGRIFMLDHWRSPFALAPHDLIADRSLEETDELWRDSERIASVPDARARRAAFAALKRDLAGRSFTGFATTAEYPRVHARLARAAIILERARRSGDIPSSIELPVDPFGAPARLRHRPTATGYRVWSVGPNGVDDDGLRDDKGHDDLLLERP
jgi:hypothetical protein